MTQKINFKISGMHCASCAKLIKYGLQEEDGIKIADVDFDSANAHVEFDFNKINESKIKDIIKNLGYKAV